MIADIGLFFVFILVALKSDRYWPMWAAGFQLLAIVTHTAEILDSTVGAWAYITAGVIWTYLGAAALAVGVCGCIWRRMTANRNRMSSDFADPDA